MLFFPTAVTGAAIFALAVWSARRWLRRRRKHDPVEYYLSFAGYRHPVTLTNRITKMEAEALAAKGAAYYIGYFEDGELHRVVKIYRGAILYEHNYVYASNGKLKSRKHIDREGVTIEKIYN